MVIASLMCGGDGLADIVGRRLGAGNPLPWNAAKSWAGSLAMMLGERGCSTAAAARLLLPGCSAGGLCHLVALLT